MANLSLGNLQWLLHFSCLHIFSERRLVCLLYYSDVEENKQHYMLLLSTVI